MPDPNYTDVLLILDRSGSMMPKRFDTIGGRNSFVEQQAKNAGRCTFTEVQFADDYRITHEFMPIGDVRPLTGETYDANGYSTSLYDAVGRAVTEHGAKLAAMPEATRPGLVVVVVLTDGQENSSKEWNLERVRALIQQQTDVYKWSVQFLGEGLDVAQQGVGMNVKSSNVGSYSSVRGALEAASHSTTRGREAVMSRRSFEETEAALAYSADDHALMNGGNVLSEPVSGDLGIEPVIIDLDKVDWSNAKVTPKAADLAAAAGRKLSVDIATGIPPVVDDPGLE
jgi:hypothetical protein